MSDRRQTDRVTTPIRAPLRPGLLPYITLLRGLNGAIKCFYYYYHYYLTRVLNSQGMKKTQCNTNKVQKSSLNEPDSSSSSFTYYYYYSQSTNAIMSITRRYEPQLDNISLCMYSAQYLQSHRPSRTLLSSTHDCSSLSTAWASKVPVHCSRSCPSASLSVSLQRSTQLTFDLDVCMCTSREHSSPMTESQGRRS